MHLEYMGTQVEVEPEAPAAVSEGRIVDVGITRPCLLWRVLAFLALGGREV